MFGLFNNANEDKLRTELDKLFVRLINSIKKEIEFDALTGMFVKNAIDNGKKHMLMNLPDFARQFRVPENKTRSIIEECYQKALRQNLKSGTY